jgi:hypothetical protein
MQIKRRLNLSVSVRKYFKEKTRGCSRFRNYKVSLKNCTCVWQNTAASAREKTSEIFRQYLSHIV